MENKTIARHLQDKVGDLLDLFPNGMSDTIINDAYITGGAITSLKLYDKEKDDFNTVVNDYDVYFKDKSSLIKVVREILTKYHSFHKYKNHYKKAVEKLSLVFRDIEENQYDEHEYLQDDTGKIFISLDIPLAMKELMRHDYFRNSMKTEKIMFMTEHSINLKGNFQIIMRFVGEPEKVHQYFDFEHVKGVYDFRHGTVTMSDQAAKCMLDRKIMYSGTKYPLSSLFRVVKYIKRGWNVDKVEMLKIIFQMYKFDLTNPVILKDQLTGVYGTDLSSYFAGLKDTGLDSSLFDDLISTLEENIQNKTYPVYDSSPSVVDFLNKYE